MTTMTTTITVRKHITIPQETIHKILVAHYVALGVIPKDQPANLQEDDGEYLMMNPLRLSWELTEEAEEQVNG